MPQRIVLQTQVASLENSIKHLRKKLHESYTNLGNRGRGDTSQLILWSLFYSGCLATSFGLKWHLHTLKSPSHFRALDCLLFWTLIAPSSPEPAYSLFMWLRLTPDRLKTHCGDFSILHMVSRTPCRSDLGSSPYLHLSEEFLLETGMTFLQLIPMCEWGCVHVPASGISQALFPAFLLPPALSISHLREDMIFSLVTEWPAGGRRRVPIPASQSCVRCLCWTSQYLWEPYVPVCLGQFPVTPVVCHNYSWCPFSFSKCPVWMIIINVMPPQRSTGGGIRDSRFSLGVGLCPSKIRVQLLIP